MGWTQYHATYFKKGTVDRKAEMDAQFTQLEHDGYAQLTVLKSSMVGSTYYGAIEVRRNNEVEKVFGVVCLTSVEKNRWISYKDMDETMIPYSYDCPISILKLLTPTDNESANEWRRLCREHKAQKKTHDLGALPIGTVIKWIDWQGNERKAYKHARAYQFKTPFWMTMDNSHYVKKKNIPSNWEVCE